MDFILEFFHRRRVNFRLTFGSPAGRQVLAELMEFCCVNTTTSTSNDPFEMAKKEGRRQVWLRLQRALNLTPEEQLAIMSEKDKPNG
jgi:hypothetical protein